MINPIDNEHQVMFLSRDWRLAAMCRDADVDMVPGPEGDHAIKGEAVMLAKTTCKSCLVKDICLANSNGEPGIYGGLTLDERERMRIGNQKAIDCANCGVECVPLDPAVPECDSCYVEDDKPRSPELFKNNIIAMILNGSTYGEAAKRFRLTRDAVSKACQRWGVKSTQGPRATDLAPCGTPAAVIRHRRRHETPKDCACARPGTHSGLNKARYRKAA